MAAIQDLVLTFCPKMHCFTTKETETLDACNQLMLTFSLLQCINQIDSMLPSVCSVIDHRRRQNVVRKSSIHSPTFFVLTTFWPRL